MTTLMRASEAPLKSKKVNKRRDFDNYPTPIEVARASIALLPFDIWPADAPPGWKPNFVDPCAGSGIWGNAIRERWGEHAQIVGGDIRDLPRPKSYDIWFPNVNFLDPERDDGIWDEEFDACATNPPYDDDMPEYFAYRTMPMLRDGGYLMFLLRLAYLEGVSRTRGLYKNLSLKHVAILSSRPSFLPLDDPDAGNTDARAYAIFIWQKGWTGGWTGSHLDWNPSAKPKSKSKKKAIKHHDQHSGITAIHKASGVAAYRRRNLRSDLRGPG